MTATPVRIMPKGVTRLEMGCVEHQEIPRGFVRHHVSWVDVTASGHVVSEGVSYRVTRPGKPCVAGTVCR